MQMLALGIIKMACIDWKYGKKNEIRNFFKSEYGEGICQIAGLNAGYLLKKLEAMEGQIK